MATHNSTSDADEHGDAAQPEASKEAGRTNEDETPAGQGTFDEAINAEKCA